MVQSRVGHLLPAILQVVIPCVWEVVQVMLHGLCAVAPLNKGTIKAGRHKGRLIGVPADISDDLLCCIGAMV